MAKRPRDSEDASPQGKRRKLTANGSSKTINEDISSVKQIQHLLAFSQDAGQNTRQSINTFKVFLESIAYGDNTELQSTRRAILLQYLSPTSTSNVDRQPSDASDLFKLWSFATQCNNEGLYTAITAVLALLLKTISHHVEFRDAGKELCNLLLQREHLKLLERGLSAEKSKAHVISPCLRLLTQIVSFDGGYAAKRVYRNKDITLKRLDTFLSLRQDAKGVDTKSRQKIPVRDVALQYLFANLRLQDHSTKTEILAHGRLSRSLFQDIREDPPSAIQEILQVMQDDVLKDEKIPRRAKGRLFTDQVLGSIATLYSLTNDKESEDGETNHRQYNICELAHAFLLSLCTKPQYGVLLRPEVDASGMENEGVSPPIDHTEKYQELGYPSKRTHKRATILNSTLSSFLQTLRPYASILQRDLTLATFQAAPELISDYFHKKKAFSFEPKLTATWLGFTAFLLSTIQMPLHQTMVGPRGHVLGPPAVSDMVESILPLPLSPKVLSRCLNQNVMIIKFFAINIMIAAFDKYAQTVHHIRSMSRSAPDSSARVWDMAASGLADNFGQRCPDMNHVILVFRGCSSQDTLLREASARLLSLYYQHLPQAALEQKFDASTALSAVFDKMFLSDQIHTRPGVESMVLNHLLDIGRCSPDMRWWQKPEHDQLSIFGRGLRLCTVLKQDSTSYSLETLLHSALSETLSLDATLKNSLLAVLLRSLVKDERSNKSEAAHDLTFSSPLRQNYFLRPPINHERSPSRGRSSSSSRSQDVYTFLDDENWQPSDALFRYLDDCLVRLAKKTVKYHQDFLGLSAESKRTDNPNAYIPSGEFLMVILEQWPFMQTSTMMPDTENIGHWLARFLLILARNGGDVGFIDSVRSKIASLTFNQHSDVWLKKVSGGHFFENQNFHLVQPAMPETCPSATLAGGQAEVEQTRKKQWQPPTPPTLEGENHPGLGKWKQLGIEEAVVEGAIGELMLCLCSRYADIRKQALVELRAWMKALQMSQYREREALYLLVGELIETCKSSVAETSLPHFAGVTAAESCLVLSDPLHFLYAKVNKFLNKGPVWSVEKLPSYWVDQIVMRLPSMDDGYYKEIEWLLQLLTEGLQTPATAALEGLVKRCKTDCDHERVHDWSSGKLFGDHPEKMQATGNG
ncbi:MAG: hypothetical protein Q9178_001593 [Gyalolechia marmorata]